MKAEAPCIVVLDKYKVAIFWRSCLLEAKTWTMFLYIFT